MCFKNPKNVRFPYIPILFFLISPCPGKDADRVAGVIYFVLLLLFLLSTKDQFLNRLKICSQVKAKEVFLYIKFNVWKI